MRYLIILSLLILTGCSTEYAIPIPQIQGNVCPSDTICHDVSTIFQEQISYNFSNITNDIIYLGVSPI